jgi:hypothetical protein
VDAGVFMAVNDHYELDKSATTTRNLIDTISCNFDESIGKSISIVSYMMEFARTFDKK